MDIQVSSNLERLLFEVLGRDGTAVAELMARFREDGVVRLDGARLTVLHEAWAARRVDDVRTTAIISDVHARTGEIVDPHTAVGLGAALDCRRPGVPMVCLATAHPAKFPDAVAAAIGVRPPLPAHLADLLERPERCESLPNDLATVQSYVRSVSRGRM
jgi:threonine synthase